MMKVEYGLKGSELKYKLVCEKNVKSTNSSILSWKSLNSMGISLHSTSINLTQLKQR